MKISVIIPTYNEEDYIFDCLKSLEAQTLGDFEVIVVDDGSNDRTLQVLRDFQRRGRQKLHSYGFRLLRQNHKGPGVARNLGSSVARGKILVFVDADMTFQPGFLEKLTEPISEGKTLGTFSKEEYVSNWDNVWSRCWNINEGWEAKRRHPSDFPDTQKVFRAITKKEFQRAGGFTPGGYTDDYSLSEKLGYQALVAPGAVFYHRNPSSLKEVFDQANWVGRRKYKLGLFGVVFALARASIPVSLMIGIFKALKTGNFYFVIFKIVYDLGIFLGIINFELWGRGSK